MADTSAGEFSLLTESERTPRFFDLCRASEKVIVWLKGGKEKLTFTAYAFNKDNLLLELRPTDDKSTTFLHDQTVLASASVKTLQFFFSGQFTYDKKNKIYLMKLSEKIYKFERRKNYRLSTFPKHQVKLHLNIPEDFLPPTNVVSLESRGEQTKLFKSFLEMVSQTSDTGQASYEINFRVQDLSTTGLAFIIGEIEKKFIIPDTVFKNVLLEFNQNRYEVPKIRVVYTMDYLDPLKPGTKLFKVGMQFQDFNLEADNELSKQISKELRDSDMNQIFEDFIK